MRSSTDFVRVSCSVGEVTSGLERTSDHYWLDRPQIPYYCLGCHDSIVEYGLPLAPAGRGSLQRMMMHFDHAFLARTHHDPTMREHEHEHQKQMWAAEL